MIYQCFLGLSALLLSLSTSTAQELDIHLDTGTFRGSSTPNGDIEKWLGIPFAEPPVGGLRFKAPVAITKRSSALRNATTFGNACPQPDRNLGAPMSEDCLFLNVCINNHFFCIVFEKIYVGLASYRPFRPEITCHVLDPCKFSIRCLRPIMSDYLKGGAYTSGCVVVQSSWRVI